MVPFSSPCAKSHDSVIGPNAALPWLKVSCTVTASPAFEYAIASHTACGTGWFWNGVAGAVK